MWKNILFILMICALFQGCNLDEEDDTRLSGDKFWDGGTPANAEGFMLSIYQSLRSAVTGNGFFLYGGDLRCAPIENIAANNKMYPLLINDMKQYKSNFDNGDNGESAEMGAIYNWKNMFRVVQGANIMIEEIDNIPGLSSEEIQGYKAESVFLRNLAYFYMVRLFGDVPYYTEAYAYQPLARTPMITVLENCLEDLQFVIDTDPAYVALPWRRGTGSLRANRGAVLTLMMHINMWLAGFDSDNASTYYSEVKRLAETDSWIDGSDYQLLPIEQSRDIFKGASHEGLFEIAQNITTGEVFNTSHMWASAVTYEPFAANVPRYIYSKAFLRDLYPQEEPDKRKEIWFANIKYDELGNILPPGANPSHPEYGSVKEIEIIKMLNQDMNGTDVVANSGNYIVFRFADAILLYAEALNNLGNADEALVQVNRIRERAGASLFTRDNDLGSSIYWERVRELMGEGQYFYDLVRTQKLCDADYATFSDGTGHRERMANFLQGAWTWPVFKGALENNPNMSKNLFWE